MASFIFLSHIFLSSRFRRTKQSSTPEAENITVGVGVNQFVLRPLIVRERLLRRRAIAIVKSVNPRRSLRLDRFTVSRTDNPFYSSSLTNEVEPYTESDDLRREVIVQIIAVDNENRVSRRRAPIDV